jgi:trimethylamine--corrinoid protein Co-methyltransferase
MSAVEETTRRRGGREARKAIRFTAIPRDASPVRPGLAAGQYKRLKKADLDKIHHAALDVLEKVGIANSIPSCVEVLGAKGCNWAMTGGCGFPVR